MLTLSLPPLSKDDPLIEEKKRLLDSRNLKFNFQLVVPSSRENLLQLLDQMVQTARILYLNEVELYFVEDDDLGPFSNRNEIESFNSIILIINTMLASDQLVEVKVLEALYNVTFDMVMSLGTNAEKMVVEKLDARDEILLMNWGESQGVTTKLKIAYFEGAGRGVVASEEITIGDVALEIPESLIISEELVHESDMFDVLRKLDGITPETMLLLWSMRERYNSSSKFKIYFESLPERFNTGLVFGVDALTALDGTLLFEELIQAREHLHEQYDALFPTLFADHPDVFEPELYTWENFLWACELFYSNGMKVVFSDGKLKTCLVPIAGLLNHSMCSHILRYGRIDPDAKSLKFKVSRPCEAGEQCYLSYGCFPTSHLVTFYGFIPKVDNPYDIIPLDFDAPHDEIGQSQTTHMVRGTWLSKSSNPCTYGLPSRLLSHLRDELALHSENSEENVQKENERAVLETILSIFNPMMEGLEDPDDLNGVNSSWDVRLALDYKATQRRIISSVLNSCHAGLKMLDGV